MPGRFLTPAIVWMVLAQVMFATMNVLSRLGGRDVPWSEVAAVRFFFGALIVVLIARTRGTSLRTTDRRHTWLRSIFGTLASLAFFYSVTNPRIPLGDAVTLSATGPIIVALLSWRLLGERVGRPVTVAVILAFLGVAAVVRPTFESAADVAAIASAGAFCYALALIWLRKIGPSESSEAVVLHFSLVAAFTNLAFSIPVWVTPDTGAALVLVGTGLTGGIGQFAMTRAYAMSAAAPLSALGYLSIVFTHLAAIPIFGERAGTLQALGAGLVVMAGVLVAWDAWRNQRRAPPVGETVAED